MSASQAGLPSPLVTDTVFGLGGMGRPTNGTFMSVPKRMGHTMVDYSFRLYIGGQTVRSEAAVVNLRHLCEAHLPGRYEIEVIDTVERPDLAEEARILATPTVVRVGPRPQLRVIGDLSDHGRAAAVLGLPGPALTERRP